MYGCNSWLMGELLCGMGRLEEAEAILTEALAWTNKSDLWSMFLYKLALGETYVAMGHWEKALKYGQGAEQALIPELRAPVDDVARAHATLAPAYERLGMEDDCWHYHFKAMEAAKQSNMRHKPSALSFMKSIARK